MDPALASAVESFRSCVIDNFYAGDEGEPDTYTVYQISRDGNVAEGYCDVVSAAFVVHLAKLGIVASVEEHDGYGKLRVGMHFVALVGDVVIDWTSAQFGVNSSPNVTTGGIV